MVEGFSKVLKLIIVFYELGKKYTRTLVTSGGATYIDDGDGNITITIEEG